MEDKIARPKTARTNQYLPELTFDYSLHHRKYTSDATTAFQQRGNIDKARQLNSNWRQQLLTKNSGQALRYRRDQTVEFLWGYDYARATKTFWKRARKSSTSSQNKQFFSMVIVLH